MMVESFFMYCTYSQTSLICGVRNSAIPHTIPSAVGNWRAVALFPSLFFLNEYDNEYDNNNDNEYDNEYDNGNKFCKFRSTK